MFKLVGVFPNNTSSPDRVFSKLILVLHFDSVGIIQMMILSYNSWLSRSVRYSSKRILIDLFKFRIICNFMDLSARVQPASAVPSPHAPWRGSSSASGLRSLGSAPACPGPR